MIASLTAWKQIEYIIGAGPVILVYGLCLLRVGRKEAHALMSILGFVLVSFTLICFFIIFLGNISPEDASNFIPHLMTLATVGISIFAIYAVQNW